MASTRCVLVVTSKTSWPSSIYLPFCFPRISVGPKARVQQELLSHSFGQSLSQSDQTDTDSAQSNFFESQWVSATVAERQ